MSEPNKCMICDEDLSVGLITTIGERGRDTLNKASTSRNDTLRFVSGAKVHRRCQQRYTNKKSVAAASQKRHLDKESTPSLRSTSTFDLRNECLFCGHYLFKRTKKNTDVFPDRTEKQFLITIKEKCNIRKDQWAQAVLGRLEYCQDLHALEVKYHQQCSVNFRTGKSLPFEYSSKEDVRKTTSRGRPVSKESKEAFDHIISYLERKEDETLTVQHLVTEMEEYGLDVYSSRHLKKRLKEHYGDTLFFSERDGLSDVVTLRENASKILSSFHESGDCESEEAEKEKIIATAARLIKADIKSIEKNKTYYSSSSTMSSLEAHNAFLPDSLKYFMKTLFSTVENNLTTASLGHALIQATRPKSLLSPLQLGLGVQVYHQTGSRQVVDTLHKLGFCCSYNEIRTFQKSAAKDNAEEQPIPFEQSFVQFVADNVDHNIDTLDGLNTFHGMGMISVHTPRSPKTRIIKRQECSMDEIREMAKIKIIFSDSKHKPASLIYKTLSVPDIQNPLANADLLWRSSWIYHPQRPLWSGFMQSIMKNENCKDISTIEFLPIIDLKPTDDSCVLSTLIYLSSQAKLYRTTPVITFDQPLYWKAKIIMERNKTDDAIRDIVLRLGGFHTAMSFLGCIGHVMEGSGFENALQVCYAANTVPYIMNGKAYSRAVRAHYLMDSALHALLMSDIFHHPIPVVKCLSATHSGDETEEMVSHVDQQESAIAEEVLDTEMTIEEEEIQALVDALINKALTVNELNDDRNIKKIHQGLIEKRQEYTEHKTAQLWFQYLDMVGLLRDFVQAERTGDWNLHLSTLNKMLPFFAATGHNLYLKSAYMYLTSMQELEVNHPDVYQAFQAGHHVVKRSSESWTGLSTDLTIEQTLMKSVKSTGGLTRGRGMDENQRALWIMSMPICAEINEALTVLTNDNSSVDHHKDTRQHRRLRDSHDTYKLIQYLSDRNPFSGVKDLRNISTGQVADASVTVHQAQSVGEAIVSSMKQENALAFSFKRKQQLISMSAKTTCKVKDKTIHVDPRLLFQRLTTVADLTLEEGDNVMEYELCSFPPALFESSGLPLEARKPTLRDALCALCKGTAERPCLPEDDYRYVLDGGSLLHKLLWTRGMTICDIIAEYCKHVNSQYGYADVVFDGYSEDCTTKDVTHMRRNGGAGVRVEFDLKSILQTTKDIFLTHICNKQKFICLLGKALEEFGHRITYAKQDADFDIVKTALEASKQHKVVVIGEDTDLLCLLCAHYQENTNDVFFTSARREKRVYCIKEIKSCLGDNSLRLLFYHALLGCDTTSRLYGIGKATAIRNMHNSEFQAAGNVFLNSSSERQQIIEAGEKALLIIYGAGCLSSLDLTRKKRFKEKVAKSAVYVEPQTLPPTSAAAKFHSLRVFYQVQEWLGQTQNMTPTNWGFHIQNGRLLPIMTDLPPAPERLLAVVTCACKSGCATVRCSCRKHGLKCTSACSGCLGRMCCNEGTSQDLSWQDDSNADDLR